MLAAAMLVRKREKARLWNIRHIFRNLRSVIAIGTHVYKSPFRIAGIININEHNHLWLQHKRMLKILSTDELCFVWIDWVTENETIYTVSVAAAGATVTV